MKYPTFSKKEKLALLLAASRPPFFGYATVTHTRDYSKMQCIIACDVLGNIMDIVVFMFALSNKTCIEYIIPYLADLSTLHPSRAANFSIGILILPRGFLSSIVFIAPSFLTQGSFYLQIIILNTLSFFLALSSHHVESFLLRPTCGLFNVPFLKCVTFSMSVNVFALNT